jgi:hypothetical protein
MEENRIKKNDRFFGQYINENHDYLFDNNDFLEETAPLIGYVVHTFNRLDESLNDAICKQVSDRTDEPGAVIIYKMSFSSKVDLFYRMVRTMEVNCGGSIPSLQKLTESLKKCANLRNAIVHAEWYNMNEEGYTYVKLNFSKNGMQQSYWQFTPDSLNEIINFIRKTVLCFDNYYEEVQNLLYTKPLNNPS